MIRLSTAHSVQFRRGNLTMIVNREPSLEFDAVQIAAVSDPDAAGVYARRFYPRSTMARVL